MTNRQSAASIGNVDGYARGQHREDEEREAPAPSTASNSARDLVALLHEHRADGGSEVATERLLIGIEPPIRAFLRRRTRTLRVSDDFVQEATQQSLVSIVLGLHACRASDDGELVAWALGVARNQLAELLRREGPWGDSLHDQRVPDVEGDSYYTSVADSEDVDPGLEALLEVVGRISSGLRGDAAALLWLRLVADYEWHEVGAELGISAGAAKLRFQRMQVALRAQVRQQLADLPTAARDAARAWLTRQLGEIDDD